MEGVQKLLLEADGLGMDVNKGTAAGTAGTAGTACISPVAMTLQLHCQQAATSYSTMLPVSTVL